MEDIQLPPGYKEDDLEDLPPAGKKRGPNRYFAHIQKHDQWKKGIQGYLASIHYADAMLGRVLDALESGPNKDNTIIALWSDHGWHLGEKQHWQKFTAWRAVTRIPLILRVPKKASPALPAGTNAGTICTKPVDLLSLYPTLTELAGLPAKTDNDGNSLVPLLKDPKSKWNHVALTHLGEPGSYGLSTENWRYIHYANNDEELYDTVNDPYEWNNLAANPKHSEKLTSLRALGPNKVSPKIEPKIESLSALPWHSLSGKKSSPASTPDGPNVDITFINQGNKPVELFWIDRQGKPKSYGMINKKKPKRQQTRPGAVWKVSLPEGGRSLGYFIVGDRKAKAVVPVSETR